MDVGNIIEIKLNLEEQYRDFLSRFYSEVALAKLISNIDCIGIDINGIDLSDEQYYQIFKTANQLGVIIIDIKNYVCQSEKTLTINGPIKSGVCLHFNNPVIILGHIEKGAKICCGGNVLVVGRVAGSIILKKETNQLIAASLHQAQLQIGIVKNIVSSDKETRVFVKNNKLYWEVAHG